MPEVDSDHTLVRVRAAGLCATDLKLIAGLTAPAPLLPLIPGHEVAGELVDDCGELSAGQRVACHITEACGRCHECLRGLPVLCPKGARLGLDINGGMAEYVAVRRDLVLPFDDETSFEHAAVAMDSVTTPWRAVLNDGRATAGEHVAIVGIGGLGINAVQIAAAIGASVAAIDVDERRLDEARAAGAALAVGPDQLDAVRDWAGNRIDLAIELSGRREGFETAATLVRPGGRVVSCGYAPGVEYGMDSARLVLDNIQVIGSRNTTVPVSEMALQAVASGMVTPQIADRLALEEVNVALDRLAEGRAAGRLVLVP